MPHSASAIRNIFYTDDFGTINCFLIPVGGDISIGYREFSSIEDTNYIPQINGDSPRYIRLYMTSSLGIPLKVASAVWMFNEQLCSSQPSYFEWEILEGGNICQLKIKGNVGKLTANTNLLIECVAQAGADGSTSTTAVKASCPIYLRQQTSETYRCTIAAVNPESNYTILDDTTPLKLQCIVYDWLGNVVTDRGLGYSWTKRTTDAQGHLVWTPLDVTNGASIELFGRDVDSQAQIRVVVSLNGSDIADDTQTVYDNHDPYYIEVKPTPDDERIRKGNPNRQAIAYAIAIKRLSNGNLADSASVTITLSDVYGNDITGNNRPHVNLPWRATPGNNEYGPNSTIFTVTADDFINAEREIIMAIEATINN